MPSVAWLVAAAVVATRCGGRSAAASRCGGEVGDASDGALLTCRSATIWS
jgi:hypothetical protein